MRNVKFLLFLAILFSTYPVQSFLQEAAVGQSLSDNFTYTVKVVDVTGMPVVGAEVVVLSVEYDLADGRIVREPIEKKMTDKDGIATVNLDFRQYQDACIVVWKKSLALTWDYLDRRSLPVDKSEIIMVLEKPSVLAGIVVDKSGNPVAGARLRAELDSDFLEYEHRINAPENWLTVQTDDKGHFCFNNIPPDGVADFLVSAPGKANLYTFMASDTMPGARYAAGRNDIRIVLSNEAKIQGRVVDRKGNPVAGVRLLARSYKRVANYYCTNRTISDQDGRFLFENVPADTYSLQIIAPLKTMAEWISKDIKVVAHEGKTTDDVVVRVSKGGLVEVFVQNATTNHPCENVYVSLMKKPIYGKVPCFYQGIKTDSNGRAVIRAPLGPCHMFAGGGKYSRFDDKVSVKNKPSQMTVRLYSNEQTEVSGTVRDQSGRVVSNAVVVFVPNGNGAIRSDSNGRFRVGLQAQSKRACIFARDAQHNLAGVIELQNLTEPVDIVLKPALKFTGCVTDPSNRPIPAAKVQFANRYTGWLSRIGTEVITDTNGLFEISAIPPIQKDFEYRLSIKAAGYCHIEYGRITISEPIENRVELGSFVLQPLEPDLSISGVLVDSEGKPAPDRIICLSGPSGSTEQPRKHIVTDTEGRFCFNRLSKGPLRLQAGWASDKDVAYLHAQAGDRDLKVVLGQKRVHTNSVSLIGKSLPELEEFGLQSTLEAAAGKKVVVCFWDLDQRPSRICTQQLSRKAKSLADTDIFVVSVLTINIPEASLAEQLKKYNIKIPTGMLKGEIAELGRTWAVQSQPWLILTDCNHIVAAEGFSFNELDEKIKEIKNARDEKNN